MWYLETRRQDICENRREEEKKKGGGLWLSAARKDRKKPVSFKNSI
jgi:hypothetical protein